MAVLRRWRTVSLVTRITYRVAGVLVAGLTAAAATHLALTTTRLTPEVAFAQDVPLAAPTAETSSSLRPIESTFLIEATEGGRAVAEISRLAVGNAASSEIREFAQQLTADYNQINTALETLARRKTVTLPLAPTSYSDNYRQLAAQSGTKFDREFIRASAKLCQRELHWCETAVAQAKDLDVREFAGNMLPVLRKQVNKTTELEKSL